MSSKKLGHVFLYLFGELVSKGVPFALLPYLTRKLGTESFGELSYYLSIVAVIMIFISLGQEAATLSYYYKKGKKALSYLIVTGFLINLTMSLLISCILYLFLKNTFIIVFLASLSVIYSFYLAILQAQQKVKQYICVQIICALLIAIFTFIFLEYNISDFVNKRLESLIAAYIVVSVPFFVFFLKSIRKININRLKLYTAYVFSYGLPLILHQLGIYAKGQLDRVFIYQQYSKAELGVYSAGVQVAALLPVVLLAMNKAIVPYYYQSLKDNSLTIGVIKKYTLYSLPFCVLPALVAWCIPEQFFLWFLGADYETSKYYSVMYLLGFGLTLPYLLLVNYFFYHGENLIISKITLKVSICYLVLMSIFSSEDIRLVPYALILSNVILILILWGVLGSFEKNKAIQ